MRKQPGLELEEVNYVKAGVLDVATVKSIIAKAGGVAKVINARHATAKDKGWADDPPDADTFAKAVVKEVNLLKRPIVIAGDTAIVGFNKTEYGKLG